MPLVPLDDFVAAMHDYLLHNGLEAVMRGVSRANEYVAAQAPWKLAKDPAQAEALNETLATLTHALAVLTVLLAPFMPGKAESVWRQLGAPGLVRDQRIDRLDALDPTGWTVTKGAPLFPREAPAAP
jgi:methionyl-tRNA synthetase